MEVRPGSPVSLRTSQRYSSSDRINEKGSDDLILKRGEATNPVTIDHAAGRPIGGTSVDAEDLAIGRFVNSHLQVFQRGARTSHLKKSDFPDTGQRAMRPPFASTW
jgi:hypothetical protein